MFGPLILVHLRFFAENHFLLVPPANYDKKLTWHSTRLYFAFWQLAYDIHEWFCYHQSSLKRFLKINIKLCGVCTKSSRPCGEKKNGSRGGFSWDDLNQDSVIQDHADHGASKKLIRQSMIWVILDHTESWFKPPQRNAPWTSDIQRNCSVYCLAIYMLTAHFSPWGLWVGNA